MRRALVLVALMMGCGSGSASEDGTGDGDTGSVVDDDTGSPSADSSDDTGATETGSTELDSGAVDSTAPEDTDVTETTADAEADAADAEPDADALTDSAAEDPIDAPPVTSPEPITESVLFPMGVTTGDASETRTIAWTNYTGTAPLTLAVWKMSGAAYVKELPVITVKPVDGYVLTDVLGLEAGARYRYAFFEMDGATRKARSPIGSFRAAIAAGTKEPLTFGASSCIHQGRPLNPLGQAAKLNLDAFLLLGDSSYNDGAISVPEFRNKWFQNLRVDNYRAMRGSTSIIATWDDHEVDNDWAGDSEPLEKRNNAIKVFYEVTPVQRSTVDPNRLWRSLKWGDTVEIFVLDSRSERKPSTRTTADAEYISKAQQAWLQDGLKKSTATFKLIMNSVPISNFPHVFDFAAKDRWEGYAAQRTAVLKYIDDNKIGGVLWVSGDFHLASVGRVSPSGVGSTQIEALVGPGDNTGNTLSLSLGKPQFDWASNTSNITTIALDPATRAVKLTWIDGSGKTLKEQSYTL